MTSETSGKLHGALFEAQKVLLPIIGSAMFCTWAFAWALNRSVLPAEFGSAGDAYLSSTIAYVVTALVLLYRFVKGSATLTRRGVFAFTALASAATLAETLVPHVLQGGWGYFAAMACIGFVNGVCLLYLTIVWGTRFVISGRRASLTIVVSFLLAFVINIIFELAPYPSGAILVVVFPAASTLLWYIDAVSRQELTNDVWPEGGSEGGRAGEMLAGDISPTLLPWRTISVLSIVGFLASFFSSFITPAGMRENPQTVSFLAAILLCLVYAATLAKKGSYSSIRGAYLLLIPVATLALLLIVMRGGEVFVLSCGIMMGSAYLLQVVIWVLLAQACVREGLSPLVAFGVGGLLVTALQIAGNLAGRSVQLIYEQFSVNSSLSMFALVAILVLTTSAAFLFYSDEVRGVPSDPVEEYDLAEDQDFRAAVERFAARHGLSEREQEVFGYFVRGRNIPYTAERLYVTSGTVKSHSSHIFQKAGVTSRQQLLDLFEAELLPAGSKVSDRSE